MAQATTRNYYKILGVTQKTKKADLKKNTGNWQKNTTQTPIREVR
jgi:hypothetical protein